MEYLMVTTKAEIKHDMEDDEECFQNSVSYIMIKKIPLK
jgi:hypothetical protein